MGTHLVELAAAGARDRAEVGGKAGVLGELARAGFPVPPGFVVTSSAIDRDSGAVDRAIAEAAERLGAARFAVRSSAAAEDLPDASYAGLYETLLDVEPARLADAVRRCFASAAGDRVRAYHTRHSGDEGGATGLRRGMAVLVQPMVDADAAGVAFTANPITGDRNETVVTAVRGLGERLVSGTAVGEEWTIVRGGRVDPEAAPVRTRRDEAGADVLSSGQAREVAALARRVADRLQTPQDIEWAVAAGRLFLLQARPITALPEPAEWTSPGPGVWMRNFRVGEWLPEPMTPLFADWLLPEIEAGFYDGMRATVGTVLEFRRAAVNGWYYATPNPAITPRRLVGALTTTRGRLIRVVYPALIQAGRNPAAADRAVLRRLYEQWRDDVWPRYRQLVTDAEIEADTAPGDRLVQIVDRVARAAGEHLWSLAMVGGAAWKMEGCLARFARRHLTAALPDGPQVLLRGLPGVAAATPPHAVYSLDWSHSTTGELRHNEHDQGTWAEQHDVGERRDRLTAGRRAAEDACRAELADRPRLLARFTALLDTAQRYAVIREQQARDLTFGWPLLRRCARRLGQRLTAEDVIDEPGDVFFLTRPELTARGRDHHGDVVAERRTTWERQRRMAAPLVLGKPPPLLAAVLHAGSHAPRTRGTLPAGAIVGEPASPGRAIGRARVLRGPGDFGKFQPGEVLVAAATTPAWTPLFARAAGVVTDGGTLAAHASLVAREYGIPAVVATGAATRRLRDGQFVAVDGTTGTVTPQSTTR